MNAKISVLVICAEAIIYLLFYDLHDCTFNERLAVISLTYWDITFSALHMLGYGSKFIHIVEFGYTNIQSKIKINGLRI